MVLNENDVFDSIKNVKDPDLNLTLEVISGIKSIKCSENKVTINLELTQPIYWVAQPINELCIKELRKLSDSTEFEILLHEKPNDLSTRQTLPNVKNIIAIASGKGGVGKSSIAANISAELAKKSNFVGILDGDVYGPSQPTMFGLKNAKLEAARMPDGSTAARPTTKFNVKVASMGFIMNPNEAAIVRGPMLAGYFSMLFEQIAWGPLDFLVFDLPPGTGDIQLTLTQKIPLTGAVVVTTPQEIALADVRRSISMFDKVKVEVLGIVENMSYFATEDVPGKKYYIFGEGGGKQIAEEYKLDLLGEVPLDMNMRDSNDGGVPVVIKHENSDPAKEIKSITEKIVSKIRRKNYELQNTGDLEISI